LTTIEQLRRIPLFEGLSDEQLRETFEAGSESFVPAGGVGGRENEPVGHLYVILEGEFRWSKKVDGGEVVMNTYGPGEFFAEVPLLLGKPFLATWRALADSRVFALPDKTFRRMLASNPSFSNTILETMAQRIQVLYSVAQQRERRGSLGTLAAGLAHELNNPASVSRRPPARGFGEPAFARCETGPGGGQGGYRVYATRRPGAAHQPVPRTWQTPRSRHAEAGRQGG